MEILFYKDRGEVVIEGNKADFERLLTQVQETINTGASAHNKWSKGTVTLKLMEDV